MTERINLVLSAEKINDIQVCPTLYRYKHELGKTLTIKPKFFEEGELMHEMLRVHYLAKMNNTSMEIEELITHGRNYAAVKIAGLKADQVEEVMKDARMYFEYYKNTESWEILGVEEPFAKELYSDSELRIVVVGKSDLRVRTRANMITVVDHKYEARFDQKVERDNQPICYCWAYDSRDFIFNRLGKQKSKTKPDEKFLRPMLNYTDTQINEWKQSVIDSAADILRYLGMNRWPMHYYGCNVHGRKCTYYTVCNTSPDNREYSMESLFRDRSAFSVMED